MPLLSGAMDFVIFTIIREINTHFVIPQNMENILRQNKLKP